MEEVTADEKKPLDDEQHDVKEEEDLQPDPDETLMMEQSAGRVWSVKVRDTVSSLWLLRNDVLKLHRFPNISWNVGLR